MEFDDLDFCYHAGLDYWLRGRANLHLHYESSAISAARPGYGPLHNQTLVAGLRVFLFAQSSSGSPKKLPPSTRYFNSDGQPE